VDLIGLSGGVGSGKSTVSGFLRELGARVIDADEAARRFARAIAAKRRFAVIPWQMALVSFVLRRLPRWLFDRLFARAPRKARGLPL